ncbi:MAG: HEAT repeat domain-containing protein [Planctomycetia bacterium]|nr:HEAT repeat domain-containing protein [Planctomycetia bacterium]
MKAIYTFILLAALAPLAVLAQSAPAPTVADLEAQMTDTDVHVAQAARMKLERIPGAEAEAALIRALDKTTGNELAGVVASLGNRGVSSVTAKIIPLTKNSDSAIAISAVLALGNLGAVDALDTLQGDLNDKVLRPHVLEAVAMIGEKSVQSGKLDAARKAYGMLIADKNDEAYWIGVRGFLRFDSGKVLGDLEKLVAGEDETAARRVISLIYDVNDSAFLVKMADLCASLPAERQVYMLEMFYINPNTVVLPGVKKTLESATEPAVVIAGVTALGKIGNTEDWPTILKMLDTDNADVQRAAEAALASLNVADLQQILLNTVANNNASVELRASAIRLLTLRVKDNVAPLFETLEKLYKSDAVDSLRLAALDGMTIIAAHLENPGATYKRMIVEAKDVDTQKRILSSMSKNWATFEGIDLAFEIMRSMDEIRPNAGLAVVHIANHLRTSDLDRAAEILETVVSEVKHADVEKRGRAVLAEINKFQGFIQKWAFNGPYQREGMDGPALHDTPFGPEKADGTIDMSLVMWRPLNRGSKEWLWDLESGIQRLDNGTAYVRTYAIAPADMEVLLYGGVDDGMKIWVNGEQVGNVYTNAPPSAGQCKVPAKLHAGLNEIMVKVSDSGGEWMFGLRVCTPKLESIDGLKFQREK